MSDLEQMGKAAGMDMEGYSIPEGNVSFWSIFSILIITTLAYSLAKEIMIEKTILNK